MLVAGKSDRGIVREHNEDSIHIGEGLYMVADGMGGHLAGEVASKEAISAVLKSFSKAKKDDEIFLLLENAVKYANEIVRTKAKTTIECNGMGTTLTFVKIYNGKFYYAHVGDSRIYILKNDVLTKITTDHSLVEELYLTGQITKEEASLHPNKNIITKAVGTSDNIVPDVGVIDFAKGDALLLCSDGLTTMLTDDTIEKMIFENKNNPDALVDTLVKKANEMGGRDNISVIYLLQL